jgi:transmembrane sensor
VTTPLPPDDTPWSALGRYLAGELPAAEVEELQRWIDASPEHAELVEQLRRLWAGEPRVGETWDVEAAIRRVMQPSTEPARIIRLPTFYREEPPSTWARARRLALRVAAVVALVAGGVWMLERGAPAGSEDQIATSEVRTPRGQRAALRLPDGSEVMLGPATTIRYAVARGRGPRTVELDGEAYFTVTHDAARPFTVHTAHGVATDLGTRFGVRAYAADSAVDVAVAEGEVALSPVRAGETTPAAHEQVVLSVGDLGTATASGRLRAERGVDVASRLAWTEGRLVLDAIPLRDAVVQLGRWYDLDIRVADSSAGRKRLKASFKHESAAEALRLIAASLELRLDRQGDVVTLRSK